MITNCTRVEDKSVTDRAPLHAMNRSQEEQQAQHELDNQGAEIDYALASTRLAEAAAQLRTIQAIRKKASK